ncbi:MAG: hypothetical protein U0414_36075 [Polyangiaceae bacterium]
MVTVLTFVLLACGSIGFMSYAALAATQAIFKSPAAGPSASAAPSGAAVATDGSDPTSNGAKLPTKTASTPQKGAVRSKSQPKPPVGDED